MTADGPVRSEARPDVDAESGGPDSSDRADGDVGSERVAGDVESGRADGDDSTVQVAPGGSAADPVRRQAPTDPDVEFGWRGWVLVGALIVSFLVVPWMIILLPSAQGFLGSLGLGLRDAYLVLPLVPALGLGALAVWSAVASRRN